MSKRAMIERVLLVDDDIVYIMMVEYWFKHFFPETDFRYVHETTKIVDEIEDYAPQLLILDVNLPIKSGWELLSDIEGMLKKKNFVKPFIAMSSSSVGLDDREKAKHAPSVDAYIEKPLNEVKIKALLESVYCNNAT